MSFLIKQSVSDQFAFKILNEEADLEILEVAEAKVKYKLKQMGK